MSNLVPSRRKREAKGKTPHGNEVESMSFSIVLKIKYLEHTSGGNESFG